MEIVDIKGKTHNIDCIACSIQNGTIQLPIERIAETDNFVAEQDLEYPIEGFVIIASKRHVLSIDEMNDTELTELTKFLHDLRKVMRSALKISYVTVIQEENTSTSHFHIWLFPWHPWMLKRWKGKVQEVKEIMDYARREMKTQNQLDIVRKSVDELKKAL